MRKPKAVARSAFKSAKWDELCDGRGFSQSDVPALELLCQWHEVAAQCMADISDGGGIKVVYENKVGDVKAMPQLATMKQASAEIRALNKQLGINDEAAAQAERKDTPLQLVIDRKRKRDEDRVSRAADQGGA